MVNLWRVKLDTRAIADEAMNLPAVRRARRNKAERVLARARYEAYKAGQKQFGDSLHLVDGKRPGTKSPTGIKRPFSRIIADAPGADVTEHGNGRVPKQSILRKAMRA